MNLKLRNQFDKLNLLLLIVVAISILLITALLYDMFSDKRWEKTNHLLTWDDFLGISNPLSSYTATIKTHLDYQVSYDWKIIQGSCHYRVTEVECIAYMSKIESSVKEQGKTYSNLNHEQGHFDLAQTFAEKFTERAERELLNKEFLCPGNDTWQINNEVNQKAEIILNQIRSELQPAQVDYDTATNHGLYHDEQKKMGSYHKKLTKLIKKLL